MPNWTSNTVVIRGDAKAIKQIKDKLRGESPFDFNKLIPMPQSLNIESGSKTSLGLACFNQAEFNNYRGYPWFPEEYPNVDTPEQLRAVLEQKEPNTVASGKVAADNIDKYGAPTWYEWCYKHWGTKWNAQDVEVLDESATHINYRFDTAWCAPTPVAEKLQEMCDASGLDLEWDAEDEDGDRGYAVV